VERCDAVKARVQVEWKSFRLSQHTPEGYEGAAPVDDLIAGAVKSQGSLDRPTVVFLCDADKARENRRLNEWVFGDDRVALALRKFTCLEAKIQSHPDREKVDELRRKAPLFYFFDPAGEAVTTLSGTKQTSISGFIRGIETTWKASFKMKLRDFTTKMGKILKRLEKLAKDRKALRQKMMGAAGSRKEAQLDKVEAKILEDEKEIFADCALLKKFLKKQ
jgi:hypothetical protein